MVLWACFCGLLILSFTEGLWNASLFCCSYCLGYLPIVHIRTRAYTRVINMDYVAGDEEIVLFYDCEAVSTTARNLFWDFGTAYDWKTVPSFRNERLEAKELTTTITNKRNIRLDAVKLSMRFVGGSSKHHDTTVQNTSNGNPFLYCIIRHIT